MLTKDKRIRRNSLEKRAVEAARLRLFTLTGGNMTGDQMAELFVTQLGRIERLARKEAGPFIASVSASEVALLPHSREPADEERAP